MSDITFQTGYISRHYRPVYVSPSSRSALAEAELVYKDDHVSHSAYVSFTLKNTGPLREKETDSLKKLRALLSEEERVELLVWTTTPWTLTANMGIAVNPDLKYVVVRANAASYIVAQERFQAVTEIIGLEEPVVLFELMGVSLTKLPLIPNTKLECLIGSDLASAMYEPIFRQFAHQDTMPIIPASHVTSESGTGIVHCAPAHGIEDYNTFRDAGLLSKPDSIICHVNYLGRFTGEVHDVLGYQTGKEVVDKEALGDGSRVIVDLLTRAGRLLKIQRIKHRYPYDWKTDKPVIITYASAPTFIGVNTKC